MGSTRNLFEETDSILLWLVIAIAAVAYLVLAVLASQTPYFVFDPPIFDIVSGLRGSFLDPVMFWLSFLGFFPFSVIPVVIAALVLWLVNWRLAAVFAFLTLAADSLAVLSKLVVQRPRPPEMLTYLVIPRFDEGFPSGHAAHVIVVWGFFLFLLWPVIRPLAYRLAVAVVIGLIVILTGLSRVYVGAHWPSDVLGGYLLGGVWLMLIIQTYVVVRRRLGRS